MRSRTFIQRHVMACCSAAIILTLCSTVLTSLHAASRDTAQQQAEQNVRATPMQAQGAPEAEHGGVATAAGSGALGAFPDRPPAPPEVLDRGKAVYSVNCAFCHGSDAGGGSIGPNLQRSEVVLQDKSGEAILPFVQGARVGRGMPKIDISPAQVSDIAAWLHSIKISSRGGHQEKINIVVGNAGAGRAAFGRLCGSCHSVTGDLSGFAAGFTDPRAMQQAWIMPGGVPGRSPAASAAQKVPPVTATITPADSAPITGKLEAVDEFFVSVTTDDGKTHEFIRRNGLPKVEVHDPLAAHRGMLRTYDDKDIHDITAYLETLK